MLPPNLQKMVAALCLPVVLGLGSAITHAQQEDRFDVWEYRVGGNSVLDAKEIERTVYPLLGPGKTIEDVEAARSALEETYRSLGYSTALVAIPEQSVDHGVVRLEVTEGDVGRVTVSGARYVSGRDIRTELEAVAPGRPIYFPDLQQDLRNINRISADRVVTPILKPGADSGEVDLDLRVKDSLPLHGSVSVNDQYTADTSETRLTAGLSYDNLFQRFHSLSLQYTTAPEAREETEVWALTYLWRFSDTPAVLAFYAVDTNSDVATIGALNVLGKGRIYGMRYVLPLESGEQFFHSVTLGADYKDVTEAIGEDLFTPVSYTNLSAAYAFGWNTERVRQSYSITASFGSRAFGNEPGEFEDKRFRAQPNYFYTRASAEQLWRVAWGLGLYGRLIGQYSTQPLISNEQFSAGGANTVRGYLEAERLGDYGAIGNLEVRSPDLGRFLPGNPEEFYLFGFYDAAQLGLQDALPGQDPHVELYSAGAGFRLTTGTGLSAALDYAWPLRDSVNVQADDPRFHFAVNYGF